MTHEQIEEEVKKINFERNLSIIKLTKKYDEEVFIPQLEKLQELCNELGHVPNQNINFTEWDTFICDVCGKSL